MAIDTHGYKEFFRDSKFVYYKKQSGKGYFQVKVKLSDLKNGNAEFMLKNGLSR